MANFIDWINEARKAAYEKNGIGHLYEPIGEIK